MNPTKRDARANHSVPAANCVGQGDVAADRAVLGHSAVFGGLLWAGLVVASRSTVGSLEPIGLLVLLAVLVVVPIGASVPFERDDRPWLSRMAVAWLQPIAAVMVVVSFLIPTGPGAALLTSGWLLVSSLLAIRAVTRLWLRAGRDFARICRDVSFLFLPVGAAWLTASRAGLTPMGFAEPIVLLTAMHFHYAGFAAALYVGLALRRLARGRIDRLAAVAVIAGTPMLAAGFVLAMWLKVVAAILLLGGLAVICTGVLRALLNFKHPIAQVLLAISAISAFCGALPALVYVIGEAFGRTWIGIPTMAVSHGVLNGLGFSLCGLLGWRILERERKVSEHEA